MRPSSFSALGRLRSYLEETTLHGLRYLLQGKNRSCLERLIWAAAIVACLVTFSLMVKASLREARDHPMAIEFETVPIQDVLFPAVTLFTRQRRSLVGTLQRDILNRIDLNCTVKECSGLNDEAVAHVSGPLRETIRSRRFWEGRAFGLLSASRDNMCNHKSVYSELLEPGGLFPLKEVEEELLERSNATGASVEDLAIDFAQEAVRCGWASFSKILPEFDEPSSGESCMEAFQRLRLETQAALNGLFRTIGDYDAPLLLGDLLYHQMWTALKRMSGKKRRRRQTTRGLLSLMDYQKLPVELLGHLEDAMVAALAPPDWTGPAKPSVGDAIRMFTFGAADLSKQALMKFRPKVNEAKNNGTDSRLMLHGWLWLRCLDDDPEIYYFTRIDDCESLSSPGGVDEEQGMREICCRLARKTPLDVLMRILKLTLPPIGRDKPEEDAAVVEKAADSLDSKGYTLRRPRPEKEFNFDPLVVACSLGEDSSLHTDCTSWFRPTHTTQGIGFTFNAADFWDIHSNTTSNEALFKELHRGDGRYKSRIWTEVGGPGFALSLQINVPPTDSEDQSVVLAVHNPAEPANPASESALSLQAELEYTVKVSVSMTSMHPRLVESTDVETRRCRPEYDTAAVSNFKAYTQSGCLLECLVRRAHEDCGCIPWDFVRPDDLTEPPVCHANTTSKCFMPIMQRAKHYSTVLSCDCPGSCSSTKYSHVASSVSIDWKRFCTDWSKRGADGGEGPFSQELPPLLRPLAHTTAKGSANCEWDMQNVAVVTIYVVGEEVTKVNKILRVSLVDQLANFGGVMGLFTGMSLLSAVELAMWLLRMAYDFTRSVMYTSSGHQDHHAA